MFPKESVNYVRDARSQANQKRKNTQINSKRSPSYIKKEKSDSSLNSSTQTTSPLKNSTEKEIQNFHMMEDNAKMVLPQGKFTQSYEYAKCHTIVLHQPSIEVNMASLHPLASLYQDATNLPGVQKNYEDFKKMLESFNINVITVGEILKSEQNLSKLQELATESLKYQHEEEDEADKSDAYKKEIIGKLTPDQLCEIVVSQPTLKLSTTEINTKILVEEFRFKPLTNLFFCRDQQITTPNGIVICSMASEQRKKETQIMKAFWNVLGASIIGHVTGSARMEGGDYIPAKKDLSMLGIGLRTNEEAAFQLMKNDLLGHDRLALIIDRNDQNQDRMHLDTYFNIVSESEAVLLDFESLKSDKDLRRTVEIYQKKTIPGDYGYYHLCKNDKTLYFEDFLEQENYKITKISREEQEQYMINFINVGENRIVTINKDLKTKLEKNNSKAEVHYVDFGYVTKMYGGAHCACQAFRQ